MDIYKLKTKVVLLSSTILLSSSAIADNYAFVGHNENGDKVSKVGEINPNPFLKTSNDASTVNGELLMPYNINNTSFVTNSTRCVNPSMFDFIKESPHSSLSFKSQSSSEDVKKSLGISTSLSMGFGMFSASASASMARDSESTSTSKTYNYSYNYRAKMKAINKGFAGTAILSEAGKTHHVPEGDEGDAFSKFCGDSFVISQPAGATLFASVKIKFNSNKSKQSFDSAMSTSIGSFASLSASIKSASEKSNVSGIVEVNVMQLGGQPEDLVKAYGSDIAECSFEDMGKCSAIITNIINYSQDIPQQIQNHDERLYYYPNDLDEMRLSALGLGKSISPKATTTVVEIRSYLTSIYNDLYQAKQSLKHLEETSLIFSSSDKHILDANGDKISTIDYISKLKKVLNTSVAIFSNNSDLDSCFQDPDEQKCIASYNNLVGHIHSEFDKNLGTLDYYKFLREGGISIHIKDNYLPERRTIMANSSFSLGNGQAVSVNHARLLLTKDGDLIVIVFTKSGPQIKDIYSGGNAKRLAFQADGNLVLFSDAGPIWATGTGVDFKDAKDFGDTKLILEADGNVTIYGPTKYDGDKLQWASGTDEKDKEQLSTLSSEGISLVPSYGLIKDFSSDSLHMLKYTFLENDKIQLGTCQVSDNLKEIKCSGGKYKGLTFLFDEPLSLDPEATMSGTVLNYAYPGASMSFTAEFNNQYGLSSVDSMTDFPKVTES